MLGEPPPQRRPCPTRSGLILTLTLQRNDWPRLAGSSDSGGQIDADRFKHRFRQVSGDRTGLHAAWQEASIQ